MEHQKREPDGLEPNGSFVVLLNSMGKILLLRDMRSPRRLNLPGGGLHKGEHPAATAVRETFEESGREIQSKKLIYVGVYILRLAYGVVFLYTSTEVLPEEHPPHECDEVSEKVWMLPEEVLKLPDSEIYRAQRSLVRYYLQWSHDGEKPGNPSFLSPPFDMTGEYFDTL